jgi:hypothetical protein
LTDEGWRRATRSLVVRELLDLFREDLSGKTEIRDAPRHVAGTIGLKCNDSNGLSPVTTDAKPAGVWSPPIRAGAPNAVTNPRRG